MNKRRIYRIIEWTVALAACAYLVYRMAIYDDYASLWAALCGMGWTQWGAIVLCVALMPVNMAIEAWRWKTLINDQLPMTNYQYLSWYEAHRQVYYSKLAGLITPWRLGEYPARAVLMEVQRNQVQSTKGIMARVLSMGAVGSATMTASIVLGGILGAMGALRFTDSAEPLQSLGAAYAFLVGAVLVLLILALIFAPRLLRRWAKVSHRLVAVSLGQSLVRLVCWCVQLALVLYALDAYQPPILNSQFSILNLPVYYLLVTITPNVPVAEVGVRGAWAIALFGTMNAALAGVLLWGINTLLPCAVWPFLCKNEK